MSLATHSRRWWDDLDFFAPDVRRDFGKLFLQLERAFSSLAGRPDRGEPAGWAGLTRRGHWDRLVHSEWAVAEAAPEEFLRRAGEGELSFWQMAQQTQAHHELVWCWLDVGPDQLGACRLVQLALMFYLQHRLAPGQGKFCWGCIQKPEVGYDRLEAPQVRSYLRSRSLDPGRRPAPRDNVVTWCIGSPAWLTQVPAGYHKVALVQTGIETVQLTYGSRQLSLQLPPGERATRLMRDPFSHEVGPQVSLVGKPAAHLTFTQCGRKLVLVDERNISLVPLPSSVSEPPGKVRRYHLERPGQVRAVSWERNALHVCQEHNGQWTFYRANPPNQEGLHLLEVEAASVKGVGCCWPVGTGYYMWVQDSLWQLSPGSANRLEVLNEVVSGSRGLVARSDLKAVATMDGAIMHPFPDERVRRVFFCNGRGLGLQRTGQLLAFQVGDEEFQIFQRDRNSSEEVCLNLSAKAPVLGLTYVARYRQPALVLRQPERFQLMGVDFSELIEVGFPIAEACLHFDGLLAYRTQGGQLRCFDTVTQTHLWASST
ncbi:MAG: hypothetical protein U0931_26705 [Vulcanimicrobiota bacterium]